MWSSEVVVHNWSGAVLLPLFNKGDKRICSNYRGICLIDVVAKVFGVILFKRFQLERDRRSHPNQSGFSPGRGCIDQMRNLRCTLEQRLRFQPATFICFADFASTYISEDRDSMAKNGCRGYSRRSTRPPRRRPVQVGVTQYLLKFAPAFDKNAHL